MIRRIAKINPGRAAITAAGLMFAAAGLAALPAVQASAASSNVVSYWGTSHFEDNSPTYECGTTWEVNQGANQVDEVYNPCNARVWVHYYSTGTGQVQSFCVTPDGGLAYHIPLQFNGSVTNVNIQLTSNTSPCSAGEEASASWVSGLQIQDKFYGCNVGDSFTFGGWTVGGLNNSCDFRVWLHGSNSSFCIDPGGSTGFGFTGAYTEIQMTALQAPCGAGAPPYPY